MNQKEHALELVDRIEEKIDFILKYGIDLYFAENINEICSQLRSVIENYE